MFSRKYSFKEKTYSLKESGKITLIVFVAILAFVWIVPFLFMLNTSFREFAKAITGAIWTLPDPATFENYVQAFDALDFSKSFFISLLVTIVSNLTIILFSSITAWQLSRNKKWYSKAIFYLILISLVVPFQSIMLPLINWMGKIRFMNIGGLIFMYTGFGMGISIFMMHGFLSKIPLSLEEAAKVEGYSPIRVYFKIILPLLKPIIITIMLLNTIWIWNDFLLPYLVYFDDTTQETTSIVRLFSGLVGTYGSNITALMAGLTIMIIPIFVFYIVMQKKIISGITDGAVK